MFRTNFMFNLPTGSENYTTTLGCTMTIVMCVILLVYGTVQILTVMQYANSIITVNVVDSHYGDEYTFDLDKGPGFRVAFGMTYYDSNQEMLIEPDYGTVTGRVKSWNEENGVQW